MSVASSDMPPPEYVPEELEDPSGDEDDEKTPPVCAFMFVPATGAKPAPDLPGGQFGAIRFFHIDATTGFCDAHLTDSTNRLLLARRFVPGTWWPLVAAPAGVSDEDAEAQWQATGRLVRRRNRLADRENAKVEAEAKERRETLEREAARNLVTEPVLEDYISARMGRAQALAALARCNTALRNAEENNAKLRLLLRRLEERFPGTVAAAREQVGKGVCRVVDGEASDPTTGGDGGREEEAGTTDDTASP